MTSLASGGRAALRTGAIGLLTAALAVAGIAVLEAVATVAPPGASNDMKIGVNGLHLIEEFEGLRLAGYLLGDGMCTIGYGHALPIAEVPNCAGWTITQAQAEAFLADDVAKYGQMVNDYFTRSFNQNQFDAMVAFTYNVGQVFVQYDWPKDPPDSFITDAMMLFVNPPQFREGLTRRRAAEAALYSTPWDGPPQPAPGASSPSPSPSPSPTRATPTPTPTRRPTPSPTPTRPAGGDFTGGAGAR